MLAIKRLASRGGGSKVPPTMNVLDSFRLDNKIALVTGSGGGMGAAIAAALAQAGATVATHARRRPTAVVEAIEQAGGKAAAFGADLSSDTAPEELFAQVKAKFGRVDILVNNAGTILREDAERISLEEWQLVMQINLTAVFQLSQLAGSDMMLRNNPERLSISLLCSVFKVASGLPHMLRARVELLKSQRLWPTNGLARAFRSMRSLLATSPLRILRTCAPTRFAAGRSSNVFPQGAGAKRTT